MEVNSLLYILIGGFYLIGNVNGTLINNTITNTLADSEGGN